jgi:hypothetical protein
MRIALERYPRSLAFLDEVRAGHARPARVTAVAPATAPTPA